MLQRHFKDGGRRNARVTEHSALAVPLMVGVFVLLGMPVR